MSPFVLAPQCVCVCVCVCWDVRDVLVLVVLLLCLTRAIRETTATTIKTTATTSVISDCNLLTETMRQGPPPPRVEENFFG